MQLAKTNLRPQGGSRRKPEAGDIFLMQLPDARYLAGRVVISEPPRQFAPGPNCILVYIYSTLHEQPLLDPLAMKPDLLLIPPEWINRKPWSLGLFRTIEHQPLRPSDLLDVHCFRDPIPRFGVNFRNERGEALARRHEPCGEWGLANYQLIDDNISKALGMPLAVRKS